jgi:hypothetical protein
MMNSTRPLGSSRQCSTSRLRVAIEERPRRLAGIVTGLGEGLSDETIVGAVLRAMIAHPVRHYAQLQKNGWRNM